MKTVAFLTTALLANNVAAFAPSKPSFNPLNLAEENGVITMESIPKVTAAATALIALQPLAAIAEEVAEQDNYEYGAVDAPIGLAWGAGVLAVLTALLPLALQGGEEAFEEMRDSDSAQWGTGNSNRLNSRK
eukprot:223812_1